jgi:hypothetical protein
MLIRQYFTNLGVPVTGLTNVRLNIFNATTGTMVIFAGLMTEIGNGWYKYDFTTYNQNTPYVWSIDGGITLLAGDRYKFGQDLGDDSKLRFNYIDGVEAAIATNVVTANTNINSIIGKTNQMNFDAMGPETLLKIIVADKGILNDPAPADIADAVWDENIRTDHEIYESAGELLARPIIKLRCDIPEYSDLDALDPNRTGVTSVILLIEDLSGFYDGLKSSHVTSEGSVVVVRVRKGVVTVLLNDTNPVWGEIQGKLRFSYSFPTSDLLANDLVLIINSGTALTINGRLFRLGEFNRWVVIGDNTARKMDIDRLLGLAHENLWTTNVFDIDGNHVSTEIQLYDSPENADTHDGVTGLVAKYTMTVTYLANKPVSILSKKIEGD